MNQTLNHTLFTADPPRFDKIPQDGDIDFFVADSLRYLIQHVLRNIANSFVVTISTTFPRPELWFHDVMAMLFATWGFMAVQIVVHDRKYMDVEVPGRRFCNMIMVDSYDNLRRTNISKHNSLFDSEEYYIIFLQIRDTWMPLERELILQHCLDNYWLHCNLMTQNRHKEVLVHTYFPFQENNCYNTEPVLINKFDGERYVNDVMFPDKLRNLHGCPLKLSTWEVPPFIIYQPNATETLSGLEMYILQSLRKDLNFTMIAETVANGINLDTNRVEAFELLNDRKTNITAGFFRRTAERDAIASPTYVTFNLPVVAVILRRQNEYQSLEVLTFPFDTTSWLLLILSSLILMAINKIKRRPRRSYVNSWQIVEALLGMPSHEMPERLSLRATLMIWTLSTLILRSVYQSLLFYLYRTRFYREPPNSLSELAESGYRAVCTIRSEPVLDFIPQFMDKSLHLTVLNTTNEMEPLLYLETHPEENIVAISVADTVYYYVQKMLSLDNVFLILDFRINDQQVSYYVPKHSYLIDRFNKYILTFHQTGFLEYWRKMSLESYRVLSGSDGTEYENELLIDMKQFMGFMSILLFMHSVALIVFILEMLSKRYAFLRKFL
ncbi:uncharacterized protein LOC106085025 [Stomoxys calcitrans]|uniref:uncharacterized protein LOC106085025 n=1 Tax=Stomoxys calcitrans TaxID=35570 RepID=UPI0027E24D13|nr:uncharacterized protein LOC106085025 [Stomoxys calcitrans]